MLGTGGLEDLGFKALCAAGDAAADRADPTTARRCFEEAAAIRKTSYVHGRLAAILRDLGDHRRAVAYARDALSADAGNRWARTVLVAALCDAGKWDEALGEAEDAVKRHPDEVPVLQVALRTLEGQLTSIAEFDVTKFAPEVQAHLVRQITAMRRRIATARAQGADRSPQADRSTAAYAAVVHHIGLTRALDATRRPSSSGASPALPRRQPAGATAERAAPRMREPLGLAPWNPFASTQPA